MHSEQIKADSRLVGLLIADQFPQLRHQDIVALDTAGTANAIFRVGSEHVARFPLRMMDADECKLMMQAEIWAMAELTHIARSPAQNQ